MFSAVLHFQLLNFEVFCEAESKYSMRNGVFSVNAERCIFHTKYTVI